MNKNNSFSIISFIKTNRVKLIAVFAAALLLALLIIEAIYLLPLKTNNQQNEKDNRKNSQSFNDKNRSDGVKGDDGSGDNRTKGAAGGDSIGGSGSGQDGDFEGKKFPLPTTAPGEGQPGELTPELDRDVRLKMPDIQVDLSRKRDYPDEPSFGKGSSSYAVFPGKKPEHSPALEIVGIVGSKFLRVHTMTEYSMDKWKIPDNAEYEIYNMPSTDGLKPVKVRPYVSAKGFIPVAANSEAVKFPLNDIVHFPSHDIFYTNKEINGYYEMFCRIPAPDESKLWSANTYGTSDDEIHISEEVRALAREITGGIYEPYKKCIAIENYLKSNYALEKMDNLQDTNGGALNEFLFNSKKGSRLDFVSAYVWLLWCSDVSARVAVGSRIDPSASYQIVYADQLSVFPEVHFYKYGWVPLDVFSGNEYVPPVRTETAITEVDTTVKKGSALTVKGTVTASDGNPVNDLPVMIYLKKDKDEDCLSYAVGKVIDGKFNIECILDESIDVGKYNVVAQTLENDRYRGSWSDPEIKVTADTTMRMSMPDYIIEGKEFALEGLLVEAFGGKPINFPELDIGFDNSVGACLLGGTAVIEKSGFLQKLKVEIGENARADKTYFFATSYKSRYVVTYPGTELYMPCRETAEINVWSIHWYRIWAVLGALILISGSIIMYLILKKRRKKTLLAGTELVIEADADGGNVFGGEMSEESEKLSIFYPQIAEGFPEVWGVGDALTISFVAENKESESLSMVFEQKGSKRISVLSPKGKIVGRSGIRIVNYQEEIIALGREFFLELHGKFRTGDINNMTPREIQQDIPEEKRKMVKRDLENIISLFEKAAYGLKSMNRECYESFYISLEKVGKGLREVDNE